MHRFFIVGLFLLSGCVTSRYDMNMSMSQVSDAIESSSQAIVDVSSSVEGGIYSSVSAGAQFSGGYDDDPYESDPYQPHRSDDFNIANHRYIISRRSAMNLGVSKYKIDDGFDFAYVGGDGAGQIRLAAYYQGAEFNASNTSGFHSPFLLGLEFDARAVKPLAPFDLFAGIRLATARLDYQLDKPVAVGSDLFSGDAVGIFGIGLPVGAQFGSGFFTLEASVAPMIYLHGFSTEIGFDNDLVFFNSAMPISLGLGIQF